MKRIKRDDTEHGFDYYWADEVDALLAQPAPVQEPIGRFTGRFWTDDAHNRMMCEIVCDVIPTAGAPLYTTPPAPQPVPVKTYHDGKPWPVAPKPWVGLTDEEIFKLYMNSGYGEIDDCVQFDGLARAIEAKLREKNGGAA